MEAERHESPRDNIDRRTALEEGAALDRVELGVFDDLTLRASSGERKVAVQLDIGMAYGIAASLLKVIDQHSPWFGRSDADMVSGAHDAAFMLLRSISQALTGPALPADAKPLIEHARLAAIFLDEHVETRDV